MEMSKRSNARFEPEVSGDLQRGIRQMVLAVRPTLGPTSRIVAVERASRSIAPEVLNDGGQIARRLIELADPNENVGAMLLRNLMWQQRQESGDGATTAALIFAAVFDQGRRHISAGVDPGHLRDHLAAVCEVVLDDLAGMTSHRSGKQFVEEIARSSGADAEVAAALADIFDVLGEYGLLEIRKSYSREIRHEFVEGSYWRGTIASSSMITDPVKGRSRLTRPGIVMGDIAMTDTSDVARAIAQVKALGHRSMLIVGRSFSDQVRALLLANHDAEQFPIVGMRLSGTSDGERHDTLEDISSLVGGRAFHAMFGDQLSSLSAAAVGSAQRAWVTAEAFGLVGGRGEPSVRRAHLANLRAMLEREADIDKRARIAERIGRLHGGGANIWIGAASESEGGMRRDAADRAARAVRGAIRDGVVAGGGAALYWTSAEVRKRMEEASDQDERAAYQIVLVALEAPIRAIVGNAGGEVATVLARIASAKRGYGYDARTGEVVDMIQAGLLDSAAVQRSAVRSAIRAAGVALTIALVVHPRNAEMTTTP